jgi:hypothetical protein
MHYLCQHLVPKLLTPEHKETKMTLAGDLITMPDRDVDVLNNILTGDVLNNIITGDETLCSL